MATTLPVCTLWHTEMERLIEFDARMDVVPVEYQDGWLLTITLIVFPDWVLVDDNEMPSSHTIYPVLNATVEFPVIPDQPPLHYLRLHRLLEGHGGFYYLRFQHRIPCIATQIGARFWVNESYGRKFVAMAPNRAITLPHVSLLKY